MKETNRSAAMLYVRPAVFGDARHVEAVARGDKISFVVRELVGLGRIFHQLVLPEVFVLGPLPAGVSIICRNLSAIAKRVFAVPI